MLRFLVLLTLVGLNSADGHNRQVASDGCHKSGDTYHCHSADKTIRFTSNQARYYEIAEVADGDTIDFTYSDQGVIETRLYGIDSPENSRGTKLTTDAKAMLKARGVTEAHEDYDTFLEDEKARQLRLGAAAKEHVEDTLDGKDVFVLFEDTRTFPFIKQGKYGRYMVYVFYADTTGTRMLNLEMIAEGHAEVDYLDNPFRYRWAFIENLNVAQEAFASAVLPIKPVALSPSQLSLTTLWGELKVNAPIRDEQLPTRERGKRERVIHQKLLRGLAIWIGKTHC